MKHTLAGIAAILVVLVSGLQGQASESATTPGSTVVDDMVVTESRIQEKKSETTQSITTITQEQISLSAARDLGDLLFENGIGNVRKYPGTLTSISIRGFRTETLGNDLEGKVLILINGRRAGTGNAAKIPAQSIDRIEIIRGPAAVQYGSAAVGGLVNVILKQGAGDPKFYLSQTLGSFGLTRTEAGASAKTGAVDISAAASVESMDDYTIAGSGDTVFHNTGYDQKKEVFLNLGYEVFPHNRVGISVNSFDMEGEGYPGYFSIQDLDDQKSSNNTSVDFTWDGESQARALAWKLRYFRTDDRDTWFDPLGSNPDGWDMDSPTRMKTDQQGAQAQASLKMDRATLSTGVDWVRYDIETTWTPQKMSYENPALFVLGKTFWMDRRLILSAGLRWDYYKLDVTEPKGTEQDDSNLSPSLGVAWQVNDIVKLRASYGEAFVMPSADQMAAGYNNYGLHYVGNPDLKPETSATWEAGADIAWGFLFAQVTGFMTDFKDKIEAAFLTNGDRTWKNTGDSEISGIEARVSVNAGELFGSSWEIRPHASLVWLTRYKDKDLDENLQYTPDMVLSLGLAVSDRDGFSAGVIVSHESDQDITDYEHGTYTTLSKAGFTTADAYLSKQLFTFYQTGALTLKTGVNNLSNQRYEHVQGYPMPGRNFYVTLTASY
ncbi:MAG: TonB-dependent receptor [Pseudomonadota bacterium]